MTKWGAGVLSVVGGWTGYCLTPHRPSWIPAFAGMTMVGNDDGAGGKDGLVGPGMTGVGAGRGCSGSGLDRRTPYLFRGKVFD